MSRGPGSARVIVLSFTSLLAASAGAQNLGTAPQPGLDAVDISAAFKLRVDDAPGTPVEKSAAQLQVGLRAQKLTLTSQSPFAAWTAAQALLVRPVPVPSASLAGVVNFEGSAASALNTLLMNSATHSVRVTAPALTVDEPIDLLRDGIVLDLGLTRLSATTTQPYMLRVSGARNITVSGGIFTQGNSAILVNNSTNVVVERAQISGLTGDGIVATGSTRVFITHNRISGTGGAGIFVHTGTTLSTVEQNDVSGCLGQSNWTAGIVVSDRNVDIAANPNNIFGSDNYFEIQQPMVTRLNPPRDNLIAFNHVTGNYSSGIYVDGGVRQVVYSNSIQGNAKEGLCLDNGSTANVVAANIIQQNGKRWGQTDATLTLDFVPGRLPDGSAAAKVPGVSIDNALYNVIYGNNVSHNFGGGVKMVRTSYFNIVGMNTIESDNDGASIYYHFFGIELGAAPGDAGVIDLDFTPSRGNLIFSNAIRGSNASGIYIGDGSDSNVLTDNIIMDASDWAIENDAAIPNQARNNLTNVKSQYSSGCCFEARPVQLPR